MIFEMAVRRHHAFAESAFPPPPRRAFGRSRAPRVASSRVNIFSDRLVASSLASDARATHRARVNVGNRIVTREGSRWADACEFEMIRDRRRRARRVPRGLARAR
jgi:hypothetical protein|tara:strand:+ start:2222 stop:2536 length:315 start_codon:yes stop_codon:yes gene_type:complete